MEQYATEIIIFLGFYISLSFYLFLVLIFKPNEKRWKNIIEPDYSEEQTSGGGKDAFKEKGEKKNPVRNRIDKAIKRKEWDLKINDIYRRGGNPGRDYEFFILQNLKQVALGFLGFGLSYILLSNFIISFGIFMLVSFLHVIDMFGDIADRKKAFKNRFPFFLQTLAFVLENGSNLNSAFKDVVEKERPGTLKNVMKEVQTIWKVNGGDYVEAFKYILKEVNIDETREFVDIVQNNAEKGVPIAKTLGLQSKTMAKFINNKKMKKVNTVENKAIIPLLLSFIAVGLLIFFGITF